MAWADFQRALSRTVGFDCGFSYENLEDQKQAVRSDADFRKCVRMVADDFADKNELAGTLDITPVELRSEGKSRRELDDLSLVFVDEKGKSFSVQVGVGTSYVELTSLVKQRSGRSSVVFEAPVGRGGAPLLVDSSSAWGRLIDAVCDDYAGPSNWGGQINVQFVRPAQRPLNTVFAHRTVLSDLFLGCAALQRPDGGGSEVPPRPGGSMGGRRGAVAAALWI